MHNPLESACPHGNDASFSCHCDELRAKYGPPEGTKPKTQPTTGTVHFAQLHIGQRFEFAKPQSRLDAFFTFNAKADEFHYKERGKDTLHRVDSLDTPVYPVDIDSPLTLQDLAEYGLEHGTHADEDGIEQMGFWKDGKFYGETIDQVAIAICIDP